MSVNDILNQMKIISQIQIIFLHQPAEHIPVTVKVIGVFMSSGNRYFQMAVAVKSGIHKNGAEFKPVRILKMPFLYQFTCYCIMNNA